MWERLHARGLVRWEPSVFDEDYAVTNATPLGRLAYELDTLARSTLLPATN